MSPSLAAAAVSAAPDAFMRRVNPPAPMTTSEWPRSPIATSIGSVPDPLTGSVPFG